MQAGVRLGPYEIVAPLGAGGMGEVYRARDTRLEREVAIKVLPAELVAHPDRLRRFEQEARATAALDHPNIVAIHDLGTHDGAPYLVEELLEGESLRSRLQHGALPCRKAVEIATAIARGLAAAHGKGILHRDLKPENVFLTGSGVVKILDFGLAKLVGPQDDIDFTAQPTASAPHTVLGTVGYMAPEQVRGRACDPRCDVFALGCVLYEMLAGKRAFRGESAPDVAAAILSRDPEPLSATDVPSVLQGLVARCLEKDPGDRFSSAHDLALALETLAGTSSAPTRPVPVAGPRRVVRRALLAAAGLAGALALGIGLASLRDRLTGGLAGGGPPGVVRALLDVGPAEEVNAGGSTSWLPTPGGSSTAIAWTPDGRALVFVGRQGGVQRLYVRDLGGATARPLDGTEGAQVPAVSADGGWVVFWVAGVIRRVPLGGGPVSEVASGVRFRPGGMALGTGGTLLVAANGVINRVEDGAAVPVTVLQPGELSHSLPQWLPGERAFLYTVRSYEQVWRDERTVAQDLASGERKVLLRDAVDARYVAGHLVFLRLGTLFAVAFDPGRLAVRGEAMALVDGVAQALAAGNHQDITGAGQFALTPEGSLAVIEGSLPVYPNCRVVAIDRAGRVTPLEVPERPFNPHISSSRADGRLALTVASLREGGLWLHDPKRGVLTRLAGGGDMIWTLWTPDGERVAYSTLEGGAWRLMWLPADGSAPAERLADDFFPAAWSPDGSVLVGVRPGGDIWALDLRGSTPSLRPVLQTPAVELAPALSPDGRWLAYESNASGRREVYVQPFPGPGARVQVSVNGGANPAWHPGGRELFFVSPRDADGVERMLAAPVTAGERLEIGLPRVLFAYQGQGLRCFPLRCYDVTPDGERFLVVPLPESPPVPPVTHIRLVQRWLDEVEARLAAPGRS